MLALALISSTLLILPLLAYFSVPSLYPHSVTRYVPSSSPVSFSFTSTPFVPSSCSSTLCIDPSVYPSTHLLPPPPLTRLSSPPFVPPSAPFWVSLSITSSAPPTAPSVLPPSASLSSPSPPSLHLSLADKAPTLLTRLPSAKQRDLQQPYKRVPTPAHCHCRCFNCFSFFSSSHCRLN